MKTINKYLTEAKMPLKTDKIKQFFVRPKAGKYEIDGKTVTLSVTSDTMIFKYPSDFYEFTYILIDISDEIGYQYQQIGMNSKSDMKFIVDMNDV